MTTLATLAVEGILSELDAVSEVLGAADYISPLSRGACWRGHRCWLMINGVPRKMIAGTHPVSSRVMVERTEAWRAMAARLRHEDAMALLTSGKRCGKVSPMREEASHPEGHMRSGK